MVFLSRFVHGNGSQCVLADHFNRRTTSIQKACSVAQHHPVYQQSHHLVNFHSFLLRTRAEHPRHISSQTDHGPCNAPKLPQLHRLHNSPFRQIPLRRMIQRKMPITPTPRHSLKLLVRLPPPTVVLTPTSRRSPSSPRPLVSHSHGNRRSKKKNPSGRSSSVNRPT